MNKPAPPRAAPLEATAATVDGSALLSIPAAEPRLAGRLGQLSMPRQVLALAVWPLFEQLLNFLVGTVDLAVAGHLDPEPFKVAATDALGVTVYVDWLMGMIYSAIGVGAAALIARAIGTRHRRLANAILGQGLLLALIAGLVVGSVIFGLATPIATQAGLKDQSADLCRLYLRIVSLAGPLHALLLVGCASLRASGDTRTPFWVMVVVNVVNIIGSYVLAFGPAPLGGHGVKGIALGTVAAWSVGGLVVLLSLLKAWGGMRLYPHRLRPHAHTLRRVLVIGIPTLLESVAGLWLGNYLVLAIVGRLGERGNIAAHTIAIQVESFSFLSGYAVGIAAATLTGQYLGLGRPDRAKQAVAWCWAMAVGMMGSMGVILLLFPKFLAGFITDSSALLELCEKPIRICGPIQVFFASQLVFSGALRGAGDTRSAMWITGLSIMLVRLPAAYLLGIHYNLGLTGVWLALCGELVCRGLIFAARFWHGGWARLAV